MEATISFVPTQAAMWAGSTARAKRRSIQPAAADRKAGLPTDLGYPRSVPEEPRAATTASGGGSQGVPMERSTMPRR